LAHCRSWPTVVAGPLPLPAHRHWSRADDPVDDLVGRTCCEDTPMSIIPHVASERDAHSISAQQGRLSGAPEDLGRRTPSRHDVRREPPLARRVGHGLLDRLRWLMSGDVLRRQAPVVSQDRAAPAAEHAERLTWIYEHLADEHSRDQLVDLLRLGRLGQSASASRVGAGVRKRMRSILTDQYCVGRRIYGPRLRDVHRYSVPGRHGAIDLRARADDVFDAFVLERYAYRHDGTTIQVEPGQVVIDAGARTGATALYFADRATTSGEVHAIEPDARNVALMAESFGANPELGYQSIVTIGVASDTSGTWTSYEAGGSLQALLGPDAVETRFARPQTVRIDDLAEREMIARVDFVKLDVPEPEKALLGAGRTIRTHRPALAISLAQAECDLLTLQPLLEELEHDYSFFLDHFFAGSSDVVLYCRPCSAHPRG
jgi:FkbM family methyltransferase